MTRPVNLQLTSFRFPIPAIVSITHRITGAALLPGIAYLTWLSSIAMNSAAGFAWVTEAARGTYHGVLIGLTLAALFFHFFAGVRHLFMDFHIGEELSASRRSAWTVILLSALCVLVFAIWLLK